MKEKFLKFFNEETYTFGLIIEFILVVITLFISLNHNMKKSFGFLDRYRRKAKKQEEKTRLRLQKIRDKKMLKKEKLFSKGEKAGTVIEGAVRYLINAFGLKDHLKTSLTRK